MAPFLSIASWSLGFTSAPWNVEKAKEPRRSESGEVRFSLQKGHKSKGMY
jgi:hypothetical protein